MRATMGRTATLMSSFEFWGSGRGGGGGGGSSAVADAWLIDGFVFCVCVLGRWRSGGVAAVAASRDGGRTQFCIIHSLMLLLLDWRRARKTNTHRAKHSNMCTRRINKRKPKPIDDKRSNATTDDSWKGNATPKHQPNPRQGAGRVGVATAAAAMAVPLPIIDPHFHVRVCFWRGPAAYRSSDCTTSPINRPTNQRNNNRCGT